MVMPDNPGERRPEKTKVNVRLFDLNDSVNLTELENIKSNPQRFRILTEETVMLPFRHIEYEVLPNR